MPKVSVLMPIYKTDEKYLRCAIESILAQTFGDFEFLILDDCPEDSREAVVKAYADKRIKYLKNEQNMGITPSRNKLIEMAKGEYLAVMDHDDISLPDRFIKEVAYLDEHPTVGVVSSNVKTLIRNHVSVNPTENHEIKLSLMRTCAINHPAAMIRKKVLLDHRIRYEEEFSPAEDYALWCRLIPYTEFHNVDEILFLYRDHGDNTSHHQSGKMRSATYAIWAFVKNDNPKLYDEFLLKAKHVSRVRLFGFIPLIKKVTQGTSTKTYLFEKILLSSSKTTIKLKGK